MQTVDFRNNSINTIEKIFLDHQFSIHKIKNFKKSFRNQSITDLAALKGIRNLDRIQKLLPFQPLTLEKSLQDSYANEKFIFKTADDHLIESVLMPEKQNISICVSVQVGCRLHCSLCQTGKLGFKRNLYPHEILEQIRQIFQKRIFPGQISCLSFMGMGEPFDNLQNCMQALEWINSSWGWQISRLKVTFSTSGCLPFDSFFQYQKLPNLAVSLHSAVEEKRKKLIPMAKIDLATLKKNMFLYTERTKKRISIEYCLIKNFNDSHDDAVRLWEYVRDLPCKINLLNYNRIFSGCFEPVTDQDLKSFKQFLIEKKIQVLYRKSVGVEIGAGCGQLGENAEVPKK